MDLIGLSHALGDALGAQYERKFNKSRVYVRDFVYYPRNIDRFHGERNAALAQWTDDTEMALMLLQSLKDTGFVYKSLL